MSDEAPKRVGVFITEVGEPAIDDDGRTAFLPITAQGGQQIVLAFALSSLPKWREMLHRIYEDAGRRGAERGQPFCRMPQGFEIGHADEEQVRGMVALRFDPDTPNDATYLMPNAWGMKIAKMLRADILPRLTDRERIQALAEEVRVEVPPRAKLILPGQH